MTLLSNAQLERELRKAYGGRGSTSAYMLLYRELPSGEASEAAVGARGSNDGGAASGGSYAPNCGAYAANGQTSTV